MPALLIILVSYVGQKPTTLGQRADALGITTWSTPVHVDTGPIAPTPSVDAISCPSTGLCVAVDHDGDVVTSTDPTGGASAWTATYIDSTTFPTDGASAWTTTHIDGTNAFSAISCPSTGLCVAVDQDGDVVTSTDPTGGASAWTTTHVDDNTFSAISCPSTGLCVTADHSGDVVTSTDPTGGASGWKVAFAYSAVAGSLQSISCPSTNLCVAVDDADGRVVTSTDPTGAAASWKVTQADLNGLSDISCPSTTLCASTDNDGNVVTSTDPAGGASSWKTTSLDDGDGEANCYDDEGSPDFLCLGLIGVKCPSTALCLAYGVFCSATVPCPANFDTTSYIDAVGSDWGGNAWATSVHPTAAAARWTFFSTPKWVPDAIACPSADLCVGVAGSGDLGVTTHSTGGPSSWRTTDVDNAAQLNAISCPSTALCVEVGKAGEVVSTKDPGAAPSSTVQHIDGSHDLDAIACHSTTLCVAVDNAGDVVTTTDPEGGGSTWTVRRVDSHGLEGISCPTTTLCVAVDNLGDVIRGTAPATKSENVN
ncbi:MAG TPA: hypothetical protein VME46_10355 [Acidimicrobiales bacterium]|nr:hypothetical protein [Acidimicrobiales bacterium]